MPDRAKTRSPYYVWCKNTSCQLYKHVYDARILQRVRCTLCNSKLRPFLYTAAQDGIDTPPDNRNQYGYPEGKTVLINGKPLRLLPAQATGPDPNEPAVFTSDCDVTGCPIQPQPVVIVPWALFSACHFLTHRFNSEWMAYLKGTLETGTDNVPRIVLATDGMYFPNQRVNSIHIDAETTNQQEGTIASIHSHVSMDAFFSKEDERHFNNPADLVINRKGDLKAVVRVKLECGRYSRANAKVILTQGPTSLYESLNSKLIVEPDPKPTAASTRPETEGGHHPGVRVVRTHTNHRGEIFHT